MAITKKEARQIADCILNLSIQLIKVQRCSADLDALHLAMRRYNSEVDRLEALLGMPSVPKLL